MLGASILKAKFFIKKTKRGHGALKDSAPAPKIASQHGAATRQQRGENT